MEKRVFDIIFALVVLFVAFPIFALVSLLIRIDADGPIFFKQKRVGKDGEIFTMFKFRSMRGKKGPLITAAGDSRITRVGRFLRRTNIDELPQFMNVLRGDLSVVGPRPEVPQIVEQYDSEQREVLKFKPGFTSLATVQFLNEEKLLQGSDIMTLYVSTILPRKIQHDLDYFRRRSNCLQDIGIILKTVGSTLHV